MRACYRFAVLGAVLAGFLSAAHGQDWLNSKPDSRPKVEIAAVGPVRVAAGKASSVKLDFRVRRGFHINSNQPGSELLIPTVLKLSPPTNVSVGSTDYPAGEDMEFAFAPGEKLNVYTGDFGLTTRVIAAGNTPPGRYRVRGELQYQACDERACYPPGKLPVLFDVTVTRPASTGRVRRNPPQSPNAR